MQVIFHVEHDCLGPKGHEFIDDFCQLFQRKVADAMGKSVVDVQIKPGADGRREFHYSNAGQLLAPAQISQRLAEIMLTQQEFEQELSDMAAELEASDAWARFLAKQAR